MKNKIIFFSFLAITNLKLFSQDKIQVAGLQQITTSSFLLTQKQLSGVNNFASILDGNFSGQHKSYPGFTLPYTLLGKELASTFVFGFDQKDVVSVYTTRYVDSLWQLVLVKYAVIYPKLDALNATITSNNNLISNLSTKIDQMPGQLLMNENSASYQALLEKVMTDIEKKYVLVPKQSSPSTANSVASILIPPGTIVAFGGEEDADHIPDGWILCDGRPLGMNDPKYLALFHAIGTNWGRPSGTDSFNIPYLGGLFLRGVDYRGDYDLDRKSRTISYQGSDSGVAVGSFQGSMFERHTHQETADSIVGTTQISAAGRLMGYTEVPKNKNTSVKYITDSTGGSETRPINVYVNYIIKY